MRKRNAQATERIPLSFTAGVAAFQRGMDFTQLFREADLDLLRRKVERPGAAARAGKD